MPLVYELFLFFIATFVSLFSIVDPLMAAPLFVSLTAHETPAERNRIALRASAMTCAILLIFFITGSLILTFFGISINALRIAGGLMILSSAYGMLNKKSKLSPEEEEEAQHKEDIAFSPLAMPMLSGPGAIAVIIGLTAEATDILHYLIIIGTIVLIALSCYVTMRVSEKLMQKAGPMVLNAFTRIMGFILLGVGVQFVINGIQPILEEVFRAAG